MSNKVEISKFIYEIISLSSNNQRVVNMLFELKKLLFEGSVIISRKVLEELLVEEKIEVNRPYYEKMSNFQFGKAMELPTINKFIEHRVSLKQIQIVAVIDNQVYKELHDEKIFDELKKRFIYDLETKESWLQNE